MDGITDFRRGAGAIPWSCCASSEDPYTTGCSQFYQRGCLGVVTYTIKKLLVYALLTAFLAGTIQVSITLSNCNFFNLFRWFFFSFLKLVGLFCSIQLILSLKRNEAEDEVDTSSMSFRQKIETELKPLSARIRNHRKMKIEESIPETIQSVWICNL